MKIQITDYNLYRPLQVQYLLLSVLKSHYPKEIATRLTQATPSQKDLFNKANGTKSIMHSLINDKLFKFKDLSKEQELFIKKRDQYLLY